MSILFLTPTLDLKYCMYVTIISIEQLRYIVVTCLFCCVNLSFDQMKVLYYMSALYNDDAKIRS